MTRLVEILDAEDGAEVPVTKALLSVSPQSMVRARLLLGSRPGPAGTWAEMVEACEK